MDQKKQDKKTTEPEGSQGRADYHSGSTTQGGSDYGQGSLQLSGNSYQQGSEKNEGANYNNEHGKLAEEQDDEPNESAEADK